MKFTHIPFFVSLSLLFVSLLTASPAQADQTAADLPELFSALESADSATEANRIEELIWQHWLEAPDDEAANAMDEITSAMAGGDLQVALRLCNELVESHPDYAEAWNKRATLHYVMGDNERSVADIQATIALEPRHFGAISGLGLIFLRDNNLDAALEAFEKVLDISPASAGARRSADRLRQELGREI